MEVDEAHYSGSEHRFTTEEIDQSHIFSSTPPPPPGLWDRVDASYTDLVRCQCSIWITNLDAKNGTYSFRMKCSWFVRLPNLHERTEPRVRVPGIRMPRLIVSVDESRLWRSLTEDTHNTICFRGVSVFNVYGYERFEVQDFPFDRQLVELDLVHFVWRRNKNDDAFEESMKLVHLTMETISVLPEFVAYSACIEPRKVHKPESGPTYGSRFDVQLRLERQHRYFTVQIFLVSWTITMVSCLALSLKPEQAEIGNKLPIVSGGLLTLVAFKYGINDSLPKVPYTTFTDRFLLMQQATLVLIAVESIVAYKLCDRHGASLGVVDIIEDVVLVVLFLAWLAALVYACFIKQKRMAWDRVMNSQETSEELQDGPRL